MKRRVYYYTDERSDDFAGTDIETKTVPDGYKYVHRNIFWRMISAVLYIFALIAAWVSATFRYGLKIKNKKALKKVKGKGYFLYGNHTLVSGDAFHPNLVAPFKAKIIVGADAVSMRFVGTLVGMLGGMPLPSSRAGYRNFLRGMEAHLSRRKAIVVYPEAHIWPYYTGIRPFTSDSFIYPVRFGAPVFAMTTVHKKRKRRTNPKCIIYIDGPFYPDESLPIIERRERLRAAVYEAMVERSKESDYDRVVYIKRPSGERSEGKAVDDEGAEGAKSGNL